MLTVLRGPAVVFHFYSKEDTSGCTKGDGGTAIIVAAVYFRGAHNARFSHCDHAVIDLHADDQGGLYGFADGDVHNVSAVGDA